MKNTRIDQQSQKQPQLIPYQYPSN